MTNFETFKLSELRLDEKNYRTGPVASQRDAVQAIIVDQGPKLVNLAKNILSQGGVSPGEPIWVTRDTSNGAYIVIEGNRRTTALKLMENPTLADGTTIEREMRALSVEFAAKPIRELMACVFDTYAEAEPWRRIRHLSTTSGVGLERWKTLAKARADRDHGKNARRSLAVIEYLQDESDDWEGIAAALDPRWTTVDRVLNAPPMKTLLGINIDPKTGEVTFENGDEAAGKKLLRQILATMATAAFKFSEIEEAPDREAFLGRFAHLSLKPVPSPTSAEAPAPKPGSRGTPPPNQTKPQARPRSDAAARTTLAPKKGTRTFQVNGVRLLALYAECRKLTVETNENAAALLLRVFIELSTEALLAEKSVPIPPAIVKKKAVTQWDEIGIPLATKISCAIGFLDPTGKAKVYQAVRVANDAQSQSVASINTLHGYFHNRLLNPLSSDVMKAWDVWEPYLTALHGAR